MEILDLLDTNKRNVLGRLGTSGGRHTEHPFVPIPVHTPPTSPHGRSASSWFCLSPPWDPPSTSLCEGFRTFRLRPSSSSSRMKEDLRDPHHFPRPVLSSYVLPPTPSFRGPPGTPSDGWHDGGPLVTKKRLQRVFLSGTEGPVLSFPSQSFSSV